jgi:hypothetical protein
MIRAAFLCFALALCAGPAFAADPPATGTAAALPAWDDLTPAQRELLLAPVRERWNANPAARARMLEHARRWQQLTPQQRARMHDGARRWQHLSPERREHARALFVRMRHMSPGERQAFRQQWAKMTPAQRKAWLEANPPPRR